MQLEVTKIGDGQRITLAPKGIINTTTISTLNDALASLDYDGLDLTLDFSGLSYITSAGLRALLILRKKLTGETVRIINMNNAVHDVFEISGFLDFIPIVASREERTLPEDPSFIQLLSYRVKTNPDHRIVYCDDKSCTWREIDDASQIVANDFVRAGVRKGTHIGMFARNTINWIVAFFAAQKLGAGLLGDFAGGLEVLFAICFAVFGSFFLINFSRLLEKVPVVSKGLIWCGQHSLVILCLHRPIAYLIRDAMRLPHFLSGNPLYVDNMSGENVIAFLLVFAVMVPVIIIWDRLKAKRAINA